MRAWTPLLLVSLCIALPRIAAPEEIHPTPEEVAALAMPSDVQLSPDGGRVVYALATSTLDPAAKPSKDDVAAGWKRAKQLWLVDAAGGKPRQLTRGEQRVGQPRWSPDGAAIAFLREDHGRQTIHVLAMNGGEASPVATGELAPTSFDWSPDGHGFAFTATAPQDKATDNAKWKTGGVEAWDAEWRPEQLWVVDGAGGAPRAVTQPDENVVEWDWSPDATRFAIVTSASVDPYEVSSRRTARIVAAADGATLRTLDGTPRDTQHPRWSPDGRQVAFLTTEESLSLLDALLICDAEGGSVRNAVDDREHTFATFEWAPDSESLMALVREGTKTRFLRIPARGGAPQDAGFRGRVADGDLSRSRDGAAWACLSSTDRTPPDPTLFDVKTRSARAVVACNPQVANWALGNQEIVHWKSPEGTPLEGLLTMPAKVRRGAPLVVMPHGGPDGVTQEGFSAQTQYFAARGYAVFRPNYRGSIGYGHALYSANRGRLGEIEFMDIESGVDALVAAGKADPQRLVYGGWSWGGYLTAWTIGHTNRYRAAVVGAGVVDVTLSYAVSDINHGVAAEWEYEGNPWRQRAQFDRADPLRAIGAAVTPTLVLHGRSDKRVPFQQGVLLYRALHDIGCPVEFYAYPREPHGFTEPAHLAHRIKVWGDWYDTHLGTTRPAAKLSAAGSKHEAPPNTSRDAH